MQFPRLLVVRQKFPDRKIVDVAAAVRAQLAASGFAARLKPGARVAIGVGSRGIHNIATIVHNVVQYWKEQGMQPFLFPAMGSHGAANAAGQAEVLAHYGITEATMGCPLISQLEVVSLGKTADGIEAFMDKVAYDSDGVMLVGRVKWHTDFAGQDRERPVQDDGHRAGQIRRRAALSRLRLPPGPGTRDSQRGPAGAEIGQDSGRPGDSGGCLPQHGQARRRAGGSDGSSARRRIWRW